MFTIAKEQRHILLEFFGIKLRVHYPINYKLINRFKKHIVPPNSILLVELNDCHKETLLGYYSYLTQLGYNVEILINEPSENLFLDNKNITVWEFKRNSLLKLLKNADFSKYERLIFNSKIIYVGKWLDINEYLKIVPRGQKENIYVQHHIDRYLEYPNDKQIVLANPAKERQLEKLVVNPHYFGDVKITSKNELTTFITVGGLNKKKRNYDLLINTVKNLVEKEQKDFKIDVVGDGSLENIPKEIQQYFEIKGQLDFPQMFSAIENADYFLPLLDPQDTNHDRYKKDGTSGGFQLVYGFLKPCIIHKTFADIYEFNENDSLIYEQNKDFSEAMEKAIEMPQNKYKKLQINLKNKAEEIEKVSLKNLKDILDCEVNNG